MIQSKSIVSKSVLDRDTIGLAWVREVSVGTSGRMGTINHMISDNEGNIYVVGTSMGENTSADFLTMKYSAAGEKVWEHRYDGPAHKWDAPLTIMFDNDGNIIVAGFTTAADTTSYAYAVLKYNTTGDLLWSAESHHLQGAFMPVSFAIDAASNVFLCGTYSEWNGWGWGYPASIVTVKIRSDGSEEWSRTHEDSSPSSTSSPVEIEVDGSGSLIVAATSWYHSAESDSRILAFKYDTFGALLWSQAYLMDDTLNSKAYHLEINKADQIIIAGMADSLRSYANGDAVLLTLDSNGMLLRQNNYPFDWDDVLLRGMESDTAGNLYVVVRADSINVIMIDSSGDTRWRRAILGSGSQVIPLSMEIQSDGRILMIAGFCDWLYSNAGDSIVAIRMDDAGTIEHLVSVNALNFSPVASTSLVVTNNSEFIIGGSTGVISNSDSRLLKYSPSGNPIWSTTETGSTDAEGTLYEVELDSHGNIFVVGVVHNSGTGMDILTAKYNHLGERIWYRTFDAGNIIDFPEKMAIDTLGNIVILGTSGRRHQRAMALLRYSSDGNLEWSVTAPDTLESYYSAYGLDIDNSGNIIVAGPVGTRKYDQTGLLMWQILSPSTAVVADPYGNFIVSESGLVKYSPSGSEIWRHQYGGGESLALDDSGNIYATESSVWWYSSTAKYDSMGNQLWLKSAGGREIVLDGSSNPHVGTSYGNIYKFLPNGDTAYVEGSMRIELPDLALDGMENLYVTGRTWQNYGRYDMGIASLNPAGQIRWHLSKPSTWSEWCTPYRMALDESGSIYVVGQSTKSGRPTKPTIWKYTQLTVDVEGEIGIPTRYSLTQNYPNPFNPSTTIRFAVPERKHVSLKIFDVLGREVATLVNEERNAGTYSSQWDATGKASGVYFYRFEAGTFSETRKLLLLR